MKIILFEDIERVGAKGQTVQVADGFARNYLIPKKLAIAATPSALKERQEREKILKRKEEKFKADAEETAQILKKTVLTIPMKVGEDDKLFGSITAGDISKAIQKARNIKIDKKKVVLEENIKKAGSYSIPIRLHPEVEAKIKLQVGKSEKAEKEEDKE